MVDGVLFDEADKGKGTKDKAVITAKLDILQTLMYDYLHIGQDGKEDDKTAVFVENFISENVGIDKNELHRDMAFFNETLDDLEEKYEE